MRKVEYTSNNEVKIGTFHEWGITSVILSKGIVRLTRAIVETEDGLVLMLDPNNIKFIDKENKTELLEKFKRGDIGVRVSNVDEYHYIVKLYEEMFPDGYNYNTEDEIDDFPIIRVNKGLLNGYWGINDEFEVVLFDKFKECIGSIID